MPLRSPIPWSLEQTVAPASLFTVNEIKAHLRIDEGGEDGLIADYGAAAERAVEAELSIALLSQTRVLRLARFPAYGLKLPRPPLTSVTSITYTDTDGDSQTLSSSLYTVDIYSTPTGRVVPAYGETWPSTRDVPNAVVVTYVTGYADADSVPQMIKSAILLTVGLLYENREKAPTTALFLRELPIYQTLASNHRCYWEGEIV